MGVAEGTTTELEPLTVASAACAAPRRCCEESCDVAKGTATQARTAKEARNIMGDAKDFTRTYGKLVVRITHLSQNGYGGFMSSEFSFCVKEYMLPTNPFEGGPPYQILRNRGTSNIGRYEPI